MIKDVAGLLLIAWGYLDGIKYWIEGNKIRRIHSSKGHSRNFINLALGNDVYRLFYFIFIDRNIYVLITTIIALVCMVYMFYQIYTYYPYRTYPRKKIIARPSIIRYIWNSLLPNRIRRHL